MDKWKLAQLIKRTIVVCFLVLNIPVYILADNTAERPKSDRSISFSIISVEGDMLSVYTEKEMEIQIEIKKLSGDFSVDKMAYLPAFVIYPIYVGDLPQNDTYMVTFIQDEQVIMTYLLYR